MYWKIGAMALGLTVAQLLVCLTVFPIWWGVAFPLFFLNFMAIYGTHIWLTFRDLAIEERDFEMVDPSVKIADQTLPILRQGLTEFTAEGIAEIIQKIAEVPAVAITDKERVLVYLGAGCDKHLPGDKILTEATREVLATGRAKIVRTQKGLDCELKDQCNCPLAAAIIVPLILRGEVVGTLKLYETKNDQLPPHVIRLALGVARLMAMQMELAEVDRQAQLVTKAELDALQAQINPHFLFNTLNTIITYSRTHPKRARRLLIRLADFFRRSLKRHDHFITLREEMEFVNTYLVLEKARFGPKLQIIQDIGDHFLDQLVPVLSIQPLVENAIKHGIGPKVGNGAVIIRIHQEGENMVITVQDDGAGITEDRLPLVLTPGFGTGNGVGMSNVHERLRTLYGPQYGLNIQSRPGEGTRITLRVPMGEGVNRGILEKFRFNSM